MSHLRMVREMQTPVLVLYKELSDFLEITFGNYGILEFRRLRGNMIDDKVSKAFVKMQALTWAPPLPTSPLFAPEEVLSGNLVLYNARVIDADSKSTYEKKKHIFWPSPTKS